MPLFLSMEVAERCGPKGDQPMDALSKVTKHFLITGASSGIGRALAIRLADNGHKVSALARRLAKLSELSDQHETIHPISCDVVDDRSVKEAVRQAVMHNGPVDVAVLNAGYYEPQNATDIAIETYRDHMDVNYLGVVRCIEAVLPDMLKQGHGHLALMASVAGYRGLPRAAAYGPTKAAVISLAESMMFDLRDTGIKLQVISPGFVDTEATSVNDFDMPDLITAEKAASEILVGLESPKFEIAFPRSFVRKMWLLKLLPANAYFRLMRRIISK